VSIEEIVKHFSFSCSFGSSQVSYSVEPGCCPLNLSSRAIAVASSKQASITGEVASMPFRSYVFDHHRHSSIDDGEENMLQLVGLNVSRVLTSTFPGALPNGMLVRKVSSILRSHNITSENTLLGSSLCCDEVCRSLEHDFGNEYKSQNVFSMGGLSGFPFSGQTGFQAMMDHIPRDADTGRAGNLLFIYGPHVGIDSSGHLGKLNRRGQEDHGSSACCGSATAAVDSVTARFRSSSNTLPPPFQALDQLGFIENILFRHQDRLKKAVNHQSEVPIILFEAQREIVSSLVENNSSTDGHKVAVLGGVQINTPNGLSDYFFPLHCDIYSSQGAVLANYRHLL
jgi:hypothetical protein